MKEKFITKDGSEVTFGDVIRWQTEETEDGYYCKSRFAVTLTKDNVGKLVENSIITPVEGENAPERDYLTEALNGIFKRMQEDKEGHFAISLETLAHKYPGVYSSLVLKELANIFNKEHNIFPEKCRVVYCISPIDHKIIVVDGKDIVYWDSIATFAIKEDAEKAAEILFIK